MTLRHPSSSVTEDQSSDATADRRSFLLKLAKTATYSAPLVRTLAAPTRVAAQGLSQKMMMVMTFGADSPAPFEAALRRAPWDTGDDG